MASSIRPATTASARRTARRVATAVAVLACLLGAGLAWLLGHDVDAGVPAIIAAGSPEYRPGPLPAGATALEVERDGARIRAWRFDPTGTPRGTVLLLHGIRDDKQRLIGAATRLAALGFVAVPVDLRGHGESSGRYLTYGVEDSSDLSALLDELAESKRPVEPVGVVGTSYGAATAVQLAGRDARVRAVVAIAPFASLREVIPDYVAEKLGPWPASHLVTPERLDAILAEAGRRAAFDPEAACPRCAVRSSDAALLLLHGSEDERIPVAHSRAIQRASRGHAELRVIDGARHNGVGARPEVVQAIDEWLLRWLVPEAPTPEGK